MSAGLISAGTLACATLEQAASNKSSIVSHSSQHFQVLVRAPSGPRPKSPGALFKLVKKVALTNSTGTSGFNVSTALGALVLQCAENVLLGSALPLSDIVVLWTPQTNFLASSLCPPFWSHAGGFWDNPSALPVLPPPTESAVGPQSAPACRSIGFAPRLPIGHCGNGWCLTNWHNLLQEAFETCFCQKNFAHIVILFTPGILQSNLSKTNFLVCNKAMISFVISDVPLAILRTVSVP